MKGKDSRQDSVGRTVREQPPRWPRRGEEPEDQPARQRWRREREPFEEGGLVEQHAGASTMQDAQATADNVRILGRFAVVQLLALAASGRVAATGLRVEHRVAMDHLRALPRHDWERRLLEQLAAGCVRPLTEPIMGSILVTAEAAAKRGHTYGAYDLYRTGWDLAIARHWWEDAARCAEGIERLAVFEEAPRSAILWRRRARVAAARAAAVARAAAAARIAQQEAAMEAEASAGADALGAAADAADEGTRPAAGTDTVPTNGRAADRSLRQDPAVGE